jgi:nucleoside-diphosphate-sugar epimerase
LNIGFGSDISIANLALLIKEITGFKGEIRFDTTKPDGTVRKLMDSSMIRELGWSPAISLKSGISSTYELFKEMHVAS